VAQALFDLEATNNELKADLRDLYINSAKEVDIASGRKAIVIQVPFRLLKAFHKVQQRLVRELEKKFSGKDVVIVANRRIMPKPTTGAALARPRSRTLTAGTSPWLDLQPPRAAAGLPFRAQLLCSGLGFWRALHDALHEPSATGAELRHGPSACSAADARAVCRPQCTPLCWTIWCSRHRSRHAARATAPTGPSCSRCTLILRVRTTAGPFVALCPFLLAQCAAHLLRFPLFGPCFAHAGPRSGAFRMFCARRVCVHSSGCSLVHALATLWRASCWCIARVLRAALASAVLATLVPVFGPLLWLPSGPRTGLRADAKQRRPQHRRAQAGHLLGRLRQAHGEGVRL